MHTHEITDVRMWIVLQVNELRKAAQESSIPHESTKPNSVQQPTVRYVILNEKSAKNQDQRININ